MQIAIRNLIQFSQFHFKNFIPYCLWSLVVGLLFFLSYLPLENLDKYNSMIISFSYAILICLCIYTSYFIAEFLINREVIKTFHLTHEVATMSLGLLAGVIAAQGIQAMILNTSFYWQKIPSVFLTGIFLGLGVIYFNRYRSENKSKAELLLINQTLKSGQKNSYLKTLSSKIGNGVKIIPLNDVDYLQSKDHYTYAITKDGEYIIDDSIKALAANLNPNEFIQISRSTIIKKSSIDSLKMINNLKVQTYRGEILDVSRSMAKKLKQSLLNS